MDMERKGLCSPSLSHYSRKRVNPIGKGVWDCPYGIVAGSVDNVHGGHVLIQEVAPDGDGVAATAVVLLDGDAGSVARTRRAQAATSAGGKHGFEGKGLDLEWHSKRKGKGRRSKPHPYGSECQVKDKTTKQPQNLGSGAVFLLSTRESYNAASTQGIQAWWGGMAPQGILSLEVQFSSTSTQKSQH